MGKFLIEGFCGKRKFRVVAEGENEKEAFNSFSEKNLSTEDIKKATTADFAVVAFSIDKITAEGETLSDIARKAKRISGGFIYKAEHIPTKRSYVGQTTRNPFMRWSEHLSTTSKGDTKFGNALKEFGIEEWSFKVLEKVEVGVNINSREAFWIEKFKTVEEGFNEKSMII